MERVRRRVSYANVAATLALVLAMSGGAISSDRRIHGVEHIKACVGGNGVLKLQNGKSASTAERRELEPARPSRGRKVHQEPLERPVHQSKGRKERAASRQT